MLINKNLILNKRNQARKLYNQLHELENILNSYLKYPCNNESFSVGNAIRVVYEYATGCRLNPTLPKKLLFLILIEMIQYHLIKQYQIVLDNNLYIHHI
jgi:hypothetical protein